MSDIDISETALTKPSAFSSEVLQKPSEPNEYSQQEHQLNTAIVYHVKEEEPKESVLNVPSNSSQRSESRSSKTKETKPTKPPKKTNDEALRIDDAESRSVDGDTSSLRSNAERNQSSVSKTSKVRGAVRKLFCWGGKRGKDSDI